MSRYSINVIGYKVSAADVFLSLSLSAKDHKKGLSRCFSSLRKRESGLEGSDILIERGGNIHVESTSHTHTGLLYCQARALGCPSTGYEIEVCLHLRDL